MLIFLFVLFAETIVYVCVNMFLFVSVCKQYINRCHKQSVQQDGFKPN